MRQVDSLGVKFDAITYSQLKSLVVRAVAAGQRITVGYVNLHGAFIYHRNRRFRAALERFTTVYADGFPMILWRRLLWHDLTAEHRFTLTHDFADFLTHCRDSNCAVYYVGSEEHVLQSGLQRLRDAIPGLRLEGRNGFFDQSPGSPGTAAVIAEINTFKPDIVFVGTGMPRQEIWIDENRPALDAPVVYACGAAIEYCSGHVPAPPAWTGPAGMIWLYRLISQPRKLWYRYLVEPFFLLPQLARDVAKRVGRGANPSD